MSRYLPVPAWPDADRVALQRAFEPRDLFDERSGGGAHLAVSTRQGIIYAYRRWLGFLAIVFHDTLALPLAERVNPERVKAFVEHFGPSVRVISVALVVEKLHSALRLIAPETDWHWLKAIANRLRAGARPIDRFDRLVRTDQILVYGIELMDQALTMPATPHRDREIQYRDGLILALLSVWPIRRRSLAALTVTDHIERHEESFDLLLHPEDNKARRTESFRLPDLLVPCFGRYLEEIRPHLLINGQQHDRMWVSYRGTPLSDSSIYLRVSKLIARKFGKVMGIHDFRRSAATFLAIDTPELVGLTPGVLQHASPDVAEQHYNLARGATASRRFAAFQKKQKTRLQPLTRNGRR
jgi:integrase